MDTKGKITLLLKDLERIEEENEKALRDQIKESPDLSVSQKQDERIKEIQDRAKVKRQQIQKEIDSSLEDTKYLKSSLNVLQEKFDAAQADLEDQAKRFFEAREYSLDQKEKELEQRDKGPSQEYTQVKRRLDDSDDLLVKYVDGSIKPAQKEYVEYWISNSETIKNRLDEVSKVINNLNQMATEIHDAPIPDKSREVLNQIEEKLSKRTVETHLEENERGMLNLLIRKWLEPGLLGAAVAAASMWFFVMPENVNLGGTQSLGLTKILNSPYVDGTGDSFPVVRFRSVEGALAIDPLSSALGKILEQRKSNASLVDSGKEYKVVLKGAFISENKQHCDSGQLLSGNEFTFFVGCRTAENNWQIDFLSK